VGSFHPDLYLTAVTSMPVLLVAVVQGGMLARYVLSLRYVTVEVECSAE
jgi:hypothetical protein